MSRPACDGRGIVVLYSAVTPGSYAQEIASALARFPGASYLRTDMACPSLRPRDENGNVNCEVTGFVVEGSDLPTVYVSGDNASIRVVADVAERFPRVDAAVLFAGSARVPRKFGGRPLTLDAARAAAAAAILNAPVVLPAHYDGWAHFSETRADIAKAFDEAGYASVLRLVDHGTWVPLV